ncbi:MAG: EAL domain-containing protein [Actinomycetota bacterium]
MLQLVTYWPVHFRTEELSSAWQRNAGLAQIAGGIAWGLLPLIAMPSDPQWQMFVAAMSLGVMASNAIFAATLGSLFLAFLGPFTTVTLIGFALNTSGSTRWVALGLTVYSAGFSAVLATIRRADDIEAASLGINNGQLAADLETESEALRLANADLARVNDQLEHQATHDGLTGLAGRQLFVERLDTALAGEEEAGTVGVLFLDLDRFKFVNDSFGHAIGDALLRAVAMRLRSVVGEDELLARLGGDELVAMVRLGPDSSPAEAADRFLRSFENPFSLTGKLVTVGASVGIAVSDGECSGADLLRFADTALLRSKTSGRGRATVFDAAMRLELDRRSRMADELRDAVRTGDGLTAFLQPIVDLDTGMPVGAEALSRWLHPDGQRSAGAYMDLASELGLEADISIGVIEAVAEYQALQPYGPGAPWITVNMPPQQLDHVFEHFGSSATLANLTLEITERAAVTDLEQARRLLSEARQAGAKVLLDDFGVGQSSLSLLTDLPLDGIKIDAGFVQRVTSSHSARAVVQTITDLGERMGLTVIAEGIETREQSDLLRRLGVRLAQGYLFSPPMPLKDFPGWCTAARARALAKQSGVSAG